MKNIEKLTFSLTFLVVLLTVGLVFAPSVMADHGDFDMSQCRQRKTMIDVSSDDGMQIASGRDRSESCAYSGYGSGSDAHHAFT